MRVAEIYINQINKNMDRSFDYYIPDFLEPMEIGLRVVIPFGVKNSKIDGLVIGIKESSEHKRLKNIEGVIEDYPKLNDWQIKMCYWLQKSYHCLFMEAVNCFVPSNLHIKKKKENGRNTYYMANALHEVKYYKLSGKYFKTEDYLAQIKSNATKQREILSCLEEIPVSFKELKEKTTCTTANLNILIKKGLITESKEINIRNPYKDREYQYPANTLNRHQQEAFDSFNSYEKPSTFLLHGVTGSGKTEVYLRYIEETIKRGKSCIYLVPEISLTSQIIGRIMGRFKENIGIIHSHLSDGEKIDQWNAIKNKSVRIVLGARSAIFAPMDDLGLIILDEEHENSFKSNNRPRYNTYEVAKKLQEFHECHIVLGSATPSVSSYYEALYGHVNLLELPERVKSIPMPEIHIIDMKEELYAGNKTVISRKLHNGILQNLKRGEQTILFLNKRGYSTFVFCRNCGYAVNCPNCEISMTYHHNIKQMACHYCGHKEHVPTICPKCNSDKIKYTGSGTQKLEMQLRKYYPQARILRMDTDSMQRKGAYEETIDLFQQGKADILLGTQMVTKGFDFKNVTLVGVILADSTLNIPDYKASERTFQLITQVAGRAGRGDKLGEVIVQTYEPNHYAITLSQAYDYKGFYDQEISYRKMMKYPPFSDIIYIGFTNEDEVEVSRDCLKYYDKLYKLVKEEEGEELLREMYQPTASPIKKINKKYRWYFIIKTNHLLQYNSILNKLSEEKEIMELHSTLIIDINPNNIL